jgi:hypothetical protein
MQTNLCDIPPSAVCSHSTTRSERMPDGSRHYARLMCAMCGAFLRFLPKPENVAIRKRNGFKLAKLQMLRDLKPWEREFINGLARKGNGRYTPKEQSAFNDLCATYLKGQVHEHTKRNGAQN